MNVLIDKVCAKSKIAVFTNPHSNFYWARIIIVEIIGQSLAFAAVEEAKWVPFD